MKNPRIALALFVLTLSFAGVDGRAAGRKTIGLTPIDTYASGFFDSGGAEIVAYDPRTQRLFVVNAQEPTVDVLSIRDPSRPKKVGEIDVTPFGAVANSVAVYEGSSPLPWKTLSRQTQAPWPFLVGS
jgi:hypothetical protein